MNIKVDLVIPCGRDPKRLPVLLSNIRICKAVTQSKNMVVMPYVVMSDSEPWEELEEILIAGYDTAILVYDSPKGVNGVQSGTMAVLHAYEHHCQGDWVTSVGDDDLIFPWAFNMFEDAADADVIYGIVIPTYRGTYNAWPNTYIGYTHAPGQTGGNNVAYRLEALKTLPKPWCNIDSPTPDFDLSNNARTNLRYKDTHVLMGVFNGLGGS